MGVFAELLHMPPREVEQLTVEQFEGLAEYAENHLQAMKKAASNG